MTKGFIEFKKFIASLKEQDKILADKLQEFLEFWEEDLKSRKAINDERDDLLVKNERRLDQLDKLIRECDDYAYLLQLSKDIMWEISDAQVKTSNGRILDNEALASHIEDALDGKESNFHDFL